MNEIIKGEIKNLCDSFDKTNYYYEKGYILTTIDYLNNIMPNDIDIKNMRDAVRIKMCLISNNFIKFMTSRQDKINFYMKKNGVYFNGTIPKFQKRKEYPYKYLAPLSEENISYIIEEFLKDIDEDMYAFYQKIIDEGRVLYSNDNNTALTTLYNSNSIVFVESLKDLKDIMIFLHELGHAYYMYINNYRIIERADFIKELKDEIPAKIMEVKFIKYLEENGVYEQSLILQNMFDSITRECDKKRDRFDNLKYLIASDVAMNIRDYDFNITKYFRHLYQTDVYTIIDEKNNEKRLGKVLKK